MSRRERFKENMRGIILGDFSDLEARERNKKPELREKERNERRHELRKILARKEKNIEKERLKGTFQKPETKPESIALDQLFQIKEDDLIVNITFAWEGAIAIVPSSDDGGFVKFF